ncbi:filamentous hemagglutinin N-terminal domain-containing protein [Polynucleobacter paneuropaeus]|nr:filamentous hemagglutinin N-terminal domain-containing protein [Polynucleobacter paneuropaeus]
MSNTSRNLGISFLLSKKHAHRNDGHGVSVRKTVMASVFLSATLLTVPSAFAAPAANALPTNGQVVAGQANISQTGNVMNINQSTQRAVINWDSFNVGKNATVNFNQPNSGASTLNRVNGASKSMIDGAVRSNGQVIFVNPNGVVFGKGAEVNTGGLVATTMNIKDSDYMSGKMSFSGGESGKVINKGNITAHGINGYIALMAPEVKNQGVLIANISSGNTVALVSGTKVTLSFNGSQLTDITVDASAINSLISNKNAIKTEGGQIIIAANAASNLKASVINNTGTISADTVSTVGGKVFLTAGTVNQSGTVSANSAQADGGNVTISGNQVNLNTASKTSATGATAGGQILLGKTAKNIAQSQVNANAVTVAEGAVVDASATQNGNGGSIEVWSTISTSVAGMFKANGGALGGNGGTIDTSSAGVVTYGKGLVVDTTAPKGKTGNWLTDPLSIIIDSTAATILSDALMTTNVTLDATASSCAGIGNCTTSSVPLIQFLAGTSVYSTANTALTLNAPGGTITMDGSIAVGQVYAVAQTINVNGSLNTTTGSNGSIYLAGAIINILGNINSNGNSSNNSSSSNLISANTITANNRRNGVSGTNSQSNSTSVLNADDTTYTSNGGAINIIASGDINIGSSSISSATNNSTYISANGQSGGTINIVSVNGNINNQGIVDALGKTSIGGTVIIAAKNTNTFTGGLISSDGYSQAGVIQIGVANGIGSGSTLAPPSINSQVATLLAAVNFTPSSNSSILTSNTALDNATVITANSAASTSQVTLNSQAGQIYIAGNTTLNTAATIQANADTGGLIILSSPAGIYQNTGYIQTNGGAGLGGTNVQSGLISTTLIGATVEANGTLGGGNIIIGRDFKTNPLSGSATQDALLPNLSSVITVPTSASTTIDANSSLSANSTVSGDGGNVLVWGDANLVTGTLSAQAMGATGNGGFIETSGDALSIASSVSVTAGSINGVAGTWLLDPYDLTVASSGGDVTGAVIQTALASNNVTIQTNSASVTCTNVTCSSGTSNLGDIYIKDTIAWSSSKTLTLSAYRNIYVGTSSTTGSLTLTGGAGLVLVACGGVASCVSGTTTAGTGTVLMGMASSPTSGLTTGYLTGTGSIYSGYTFTTGAATGFNGQININNSSSTISLNGTTYNVYVTPTITGNIDGGAKWVWGANYTTSTYGMQIGTGTGNTLADGLGHVITYSYVISSGNLGNIGFFTKTDSTSMTIRNFGVAGSISGTFNGDACAGGLVGQFSGGTITNSYSTVTISAPGGNYVAGLVGFVNGATSTISNSYATGNVSSTTGSYVGGLVGYLGTGTISNSYATGNVSSTTGSYVGGLVGQSWRTISNSYATGTVSSSSGSYVGGLVGDLESTTIVNSYAKGNVSSTSGSRVGGLVGYSTSGTISNSFATGTISGSSMIGGLVGYSDNSTISYSYASGLISSCGSYCAGFIGRITTGGTISNNYWNFANEASYGQTITGTASNNNAVTTLQFSTASNLTNFTFGSSGYGYNSTIQSTPILCSVSTCTSYITSLLNAIFTGSSGGTWSTASNWNIGIAPLSTNTNTIGSITINSGSTVLYDTGSVGSLSNSISNAGTISFTGSSSVTLSGVISGLGSITQAGSGNITLSGANTYTGTTTVNSGTLTAGVGTSGSTGAFGYGSNVTVNGGTLALGSYNETVGSVTIGNSGGSITGSGTLTATSYAFTNTSSNAATISAILAGSGASLTQSGAGTTTLSGANTYTGGTTISAGTLSVGSDTYLGSTSGAINLNGGTLNISTGAAFSSARTLNVLASSTINNADTSGITFTGNVTGPTVTGTPVTLTLTGANATTFSTGAITNGTGTSTVALVQNTTGTTTLSGSNSYTGGTTITAGTINAGSGNALGTGAVGIGSSGILNLTYSGTVTLGSTLSMSTGASITNSTNTANLYVTGTSTLNGSVTTTGTQTYTGAVTLGANAALTTTNNNITFSSTVDSTAGSYYGLSITNGTGTTAFGGVVGANSATSALGYLCINSTGCSASAVGTTSGAGTTTLAGNVTTSGNQTYGGNFTLGANTALTSTANSGNGAVTIAGAVNTASSGSGYLYLEGLGYSNGTVTATSSTGVYTYGGTAYTLASGSSVTLAIGTLTYSGYSSINHQSSYSFTPTSSTTSSLLIVGGGGGGGGNIGGGGGAGSVVYGSTTLSGSISIVIGDGGVSDGVGYSSSVTIGSTTFSALGGGRGSNAYSSSYSGTGGSGGGFRASSTGTASNYFASYQPANTGMASLANNGGLATGGYVAGTGGGGAGGAGSVTSNTSGPNGGNGGAAYQWIDGNYYAGGGGGASGGAVGGFLGIVGLGGGAGAGNGSNGNNSGMANPNTGNTTANATGYAAINGTGSGGGGGGYNNIGVSVGGTGGSGVAALTYSISGSYALTINSGTGKSSIGGTVSNVTTLTINSKSPLSAVSGAIGGSTAVAYNTASGYTAAGGNTSGVLSLAGTNTYTGGTTITGGTLQAGNAAAFGGASSAITVNSGAALDLNGKTLTYANALTLNGTGISSGGALTNSSATGGTYSGAITLGSDALMGSTAGAITVSGAIGSTASTYNLALVGSKAITLSSATNTLSTIASGSGLGALSITNNQALIIGSMTIGGTTYSGLSSTGTILVQTSTGNLTVNNAVTTSSTSAVTSAPAIKLAAGYNGTTSDTTYNIILGSSSSSFITAGSGAIIALYSGTPTSSTNLSAFTAGQTTNFITYSKTTSDTQSASSGYYLKYRSTIPSLYVIFGSSDTPTYGSAPTITYTFNTQANGSGTSYLSSDTATVNATGTALFKGTYSPTSTTNVSLNSSANAGGYTAVTYLSGLSSLFYAISAGSSTGSLTVNQAQAYVIVTSGQSSTYGATPTINYTFNTNSAGTGSVISSSPTGLSGTATITNAPTSSSNAGTYSLTYASGLSSTNYAFNAAASSVSYAVNQAQAYVIITSGQSSTYGATPTINYTFNTNSAGTGSAISSSPTGLSGTATITNAPTSSSNAGTYSLTYASGLSSTNYAFNAAASSRSYTVNPAVLNIAAISKTYDGTTTFTNANAYTLSGTRYNGDAMPTIVSGTATTSSANAATYTSFASNGLTLSSGNYTLTGGTVAATINQAPLGIVIGGVYSGSTTIAPTSYTVTGLVSVSGTAQTLVPTSVTVNDANVSTNGANYVTAINSKTGTANLSNYAITTAYNGTSGTTTTNAVALTGAPLGLTVTGIYNGLYSITPNSVLPTGLLNSQTLTGLSSVTLSSKDVASNGSNYVISASGVTGTANLANYVITAAYNSASTSTQNVATLSAAPLGISVTGSYSGSTVIAPTTVTATGLVNGETLTGLTSATLSSANVSANGSNYVSAISGPTGTATLSNYSITTAYNASAGTSLNTATVTPAVLTVTAVPSQKFVTEFDPTGYGGVIYSGWVAGQGTSVLNTTGLTISRSTPTVNTAGSNYTLTPGGIAANGGNYTFSYQAGNFTIVPADTLAIVVANNATSYGTAPSYSITSARYLNSANNTIYTLSPTVTGSVVTMSDGSGGSVAFTLTPVSTTGTSTITSGSGNYKVDSYTLSATNKTIVSNNFSNSITVSGALTVSSLGINPSNITVAGLSKTYDGTTNVSGLTLNASSTSFKTGDTVSVTGSGNFADTNVGTGKSITITPALTGADSANYYLTGSGTINTTGAILQLASVTYTGASGGSWSNSANWAGGAIPTLSNVATVIIPTTKTVVYDAANLTSLTPTSAITANGTLSFTGSTATTFANTVSGTGSISQSGTGALTLTGGNSYSGGTTLASGSSLIAGSSSALGTGALNSSGGTLSTSGVTLPNLTVNGAVVLASNITSSGNQAYNGAVTINNSTNSTTLKSFAGNITFASTLNAGTTNQSLELSATAGQVTFNGQVGVATQTYNTGTQSYSPTTYASYQSQSSNNLSNLTVSANTINLNADISTRLTQIYNGSLLVGDNGSNGPTRVLLSEDPAITFNGTINDTVAGTHNLFVKAVTIANEAPSIIFNDVVGGIAALKSLTASTGAQDAATGALYSAIDTTPANLVGTVTIKENVSTTGDQTYTAKGFTLGNGTANQTLSLTTQTGNIAFNAGSSGGSGFTPAGSGLIVSIFNSGGTVSGLSGSGLNYSVTDTTASASSSSTTSTSNLTSAQYSTGGALQNSFNNEFTQLASEIMYDQSGGSVTVGSPSEACVLRYEASYLSCVQ